MQFYAESLINEIDTCFDVFQYYLFFIYYLFIGLWTRLSLFYQFFDNIESIIKER